MRNKIWFILAFFAGSLLCAQSTGYMGRRLQVGYGFYASPAVTGSNANNASFFGSGGSAETGQPAFNVVHEGFMEVAASSRWMIGFGVKYYNSTFDNSIRINSIFTQNSTAYEYDGVLPSGYYSIRGLDYNLYFKNYGRRYIAPWGRYFLFGLVLHTASTTYDPSMMKVKAYNYYNYSDTTITNFGPTQQSFKSFDAMIGFGRTRMIGKRISLDYGLNLQLFALVATLFDSSSLDFINTPTSAENYIERTVNRRVRGVNRCNAYLKIGILLF